jgi:hypothetical protein
MENTTYKKNYNLDGERILGIITNEKEVKENFLIDNGLLRQIIKGFEHFYGENCEGYIVQGFENFKTRLLSEGFLYLVIDKRSNEFIMLGFVKIIKSSSLNSFDTLWHGHYTAEASNALINPYYKKRIHAAQFKDLRAKLTEIGFSYVRNGFQGWGTGRVLWSTKVLLRSFAENKVYGFFLYHVPWMSLWNEICYTNHSLVFCKSPLRRKYTAKTKIPDDYRNIYWTKALKAYLRGFEGKTSDKTIIEPKTLDIRENGTITSLKLIDSSDFEMLSESIRKGYRICAVLASRIWTGKMFHSMVELQKVDKCKFPVRTPEKCEWEKHIPRWPPKLTEQTWNFIKTFRLLECYPKELRNLFPFK